MTLSETFRHMLQEHLKTTGQPANRVLPLPVGTLLIRPTYQVQFRRETHRGLGQTVVAHVTGAIPDDDYRGLAAVDWSFQGLIERALTNAGAYHEAEQIRLHVAAIKASKGPIYR